MRSSSPKSDTSSTQAATALQYMKDLQYCYHQRSTSSSSNKNKFPSSSILRHDEENEEVITPSNLSSEEKEPYYYGYYNNNNNRDRSSSHTNIFSSTDLLQQQVLSSRESSSTSTALLDDIITNNNNFHSVDDDGIGVLDPESQARLSEHLEKTVAVATREFSIGSINSVGCGNVEPLYHGQMRNDFLSLFQDQADQEDPLLSSPLPPLPIPTKATRATSITPPSPSSSNGSITSEHSNHSKGTKKKKQQQDEQQQQCINGILPTEVDVILGRGGKTNKHAGNRMYLLKKDEMQARYLAATKEDKTFISQELVDWVHSCGGRFLKYDDTANFWYEIDNRTARKKCSQSLREINTPERRAKKRAKYYGNNNKNEKRKGQQCSK